MQKRFYLMFAALIVTSLLSSGCSQKTLRDFDVYVEFVRQGSFNINPSIKVGNAFDQFFKNGRWHSFKSTDGSPIVEFNGEVMNPSIKSELNLALSLYNIATLNLNGLRDTNAKDKNQEMKIMMQFTINEENFNIHYMEIDGVPMDQLMIEAVVEGILSDYKIIPAK